MTIAGSDPSGSSGLQADLPTFAALGAHGTSVVTVLTAQNSLGVHDFHQVDVELVEAQLDHLLADLPPRATKTGLLRTPALVELVAERARQGRLGHLVVDPVMVDSAGSPIVSEATVDAYRRLAGHAAVLTPNRWEAELLTGMAFLEDDPEASAGALLELGCPLVVVTGGRGESHRVVDHRIEPSGITVSGGVRIGQRPIRGTGCTFSAAVAALVATGAESCDAVDRARAFVQRQLTRSAQLQLGAGRPGVPHTVD